jgi:hypothetical protein
MSRFQIAIAVVIGVFIASCSSLPPMKPTGLTFAQFQRAQHERAQRLSSLGGKIFLRHTVRGNSISGGGKFFLRLPTLAYWEVRDPLGRAHLQLGATLPDVVAYYPRENRVVTDSARGKHFLRDFFPSSLDVEQLTRLWLGVIPLSAIGKSEVWEWNDQGFYMARFKTAMGQFEIDVDGVTAALRRFRMKNEKTELETKWEDFDYECLGMASCPKDADKIALAHSVLMNLREPASVDMKVELEELQSSRVPEKREAYLPVVPDGTERKALR